MLVRFNHQNTFDRMVDTFFRGGIQYNERDGVSFWTPAVDVAELENEYVVKVELPGVSKDDVKITLDSNILTIHGEKKEERNVNEDNYRYAERVYGSFQRSFKLPAKVKGDSIDALYKDGILTVTLPKAEEAKPKQIEVKVK